jgi:flagellar basal-body rod protein FlgB
MLQSLLNSTTIPLLEKMAVFGENRHEVLAGNLANVNSPDYKTRDLSLESFQSALQEAIHRRRHPEAASSPSASHTNPKSIDDLFPRDLFQAVDARPQNLTFQDRGNRSVEHEISEITKNALTQNLVVELMAAQMKTLQAVITERP